MVAQPCERVLKATELYTLKIIKKVKFMLCVLYHNNKTPPSTNTFLICLSPFESHSSSYNKFVAPLVTCL